jgi:hypothetical protein
LSADIGLVYEMADEDAGAGPEWAAQVNGYLASLGDSD